MKKRRTILLNLLLSTASVVVAILFIEFFLILIDYTYSPVHITSGPGGKEEEGYHDHVLNGFTYVFENENFIYDPNLIWRPKTNFSVFNAQGFRGKLLSAEKDPKEYRIFTIGDSNTLGWLAREGANWPMYLQQILPKDRFVITNMGVWGYSSFQGVRRFEEALTFRPDMVLISFGATDAQYRSFSDREYAKRVESMLPLKAFKLGHLIAKFMDTYFPLRREDRLVPRVGLTEYKENLNKIITLAEANNIQCVLLTRPFLREPVDAMSWTNFAPQYNTAIHQVAQARGAPVVDLYAYFENQKQYFTDAAHFHEIGHRLAAGLIYESIRPFLPDHQIASKRFEPRHYPNKVQGFHPDRDFPKWTVGEAHLAPPALEAEEEDMFLVVNTYGWHPYRHEIEKLGLRVFANGVALRFSHQRGADYYFSLNPRKVTQTIQEIRLVSATFVPKALGINDDQRTLGIDVKSITIE